MLQVARSLLMTRESLVKRRASLVNVICAVTFCAVTFCASHFHVTDIVRHVKSLVVRPEAGPGGETASRRHRGTGFGTNPEMLELLASWAICECAPVSLPTDRLAARLQVISMLLFLMQYVSVIW